MIRFFILGIGIIISAVIISLEEIQNVIQFQNIIETDSSKVRLGDVYAENLQSTFKVTLEGEQTPLISVTANTAKLYSQVEKDFKELLDKVNKSKEEKLTLSSAKWMKNATISLETRVIYQSEFQPKFILVINNKELLHQAGKEDSKSMEEYLLSLKTYANQMVQEYLENHSFIGKTMS